MHMKVSQFTKIFAIAALLVSVAFAQQTRVFHEGDAWTEEVTGTLPAAKTLKVQVDFGSVRVQGSAQQDITYIIRTHSYTSSERQARREFERTRSTPPAAATVPSSKATGKAAAITS